jgi:hypothetical protein
MYSPCTVTAKVAGGVEVTIKENTLYPFGGIVEFEIDPAKPVAFPLYLRVPSWSESARIFVNDERIDVEVPAGKVLRINREWKKGDQVQLKQSSSIKVRRWESNAATITRGPLTYSLAIKEKNIRYGGTDTWPAYDIFPEGTWNFALDLAQGNRLNFENLDVEAAPGLEGDRPVFAEPSPLKIKAKARRIPAWTLDKRGLVNEIPAGPFKSSEKLEDITLIPMGCCRLRITAFPVVDNDKGKDWPPPVKPKYTATASHCFDNDTPDALCDDVLPKSSNDHGLDRFTWWPRKGSVEWVQYDFDKPMPLSSASVYWFDDTPRGGCKLPKSWRLLYKDGEDWKPVADASEYPIAKDKFCEVKFKEVTTPALRLEVQLEKDYSGGVLEWRVK